MIFRVLPITALLAVFFLAAACEGALTPTSIPALTPTPALTATPTPVSAPTSTFSPDTGYLTEEILPCTSISGSSVDPCESGVKIDSNVFASGDSGGIFEPDEPLPLRSFLEGLSLGSVSHLVVRGTYIPDTARCTSGTPFRVPSYIKPGYFQHSLLFKCYADVRVNGYILGNGPAQLTVLVAFLHYWDGYYASNATGLGLTEQELIEQFLSGHMALLERGYGDTVGIYGREMVLFIGPSSDHATETWEVFRTWDVQKQEDGTVIAVHPYRDDWKAARPSDYQTYQSQLEMALPAFKQAVTTAHQARVTKYDGRVTWADRQGKAEGATLPMLVTDATKLTSFFREVGAYDHPDGPPVKPPPPCGLTVPNQADNPALMRDCYALLEAKDALRGTATLNWSVDTTIAQWNGVTVGGTPKRVTKLLLANKSLNGTIPWALERLDGLAELRLSGNALTGCIPVALRSVATHDLASLGLSYCGVKFSASTYDAPEGAITSVTLQLDRALERSVSVPITTTDVTAESADYLISGVSNGAVTIPAGSSSATFGVNAHREADCLDETLRLGFGTLPSELVAGTPSQAVVTIKDDDVCPSVLFDAASHTVFEGTSHVFQVRLSTSANERRSVPVTITNGTAESGDYTVTGLTSGAVTFPGGRTYVRVTIAANQDADCDDETVTFGLGTLTDGLTAGTPSTLTVTVDDDDTSCGP